MSSSSSSNSDASSESSSSISRSPSPAPTTQRKQKRKRDPKPSDSDASSDSDAPDAAQLEDGDEEPVLSHAAQRKAKRAQQKQAAPEAASVAGSATKKQRTDDPPKRQNSVWVGNLSFKATPDSLRRFFDGAGEITRVHMPTKVAPGPGGRKENRGFAYVDFATSDAKLVAISMSESPLDGRRLLIKDGDDFTGRPAAASAPDGATPAAPGMGTSKYAQKILASQKQPPAQTLFFGNLGFETTDKSLREMLEAHRNPKDTAPAPTAAGAEQDGAEKNGVEKKDVWIRKVRLGTFEDSGLCKGFGFVDFTKTEHATAALINPKNHHMDGRTLVVEYASADAVRRGGGGPRPPKMGHSSDIKDTRGRHHVNARDGKQDGKRPKDADDQTPSGPIAGAEPTVETVPGRESRRGADDRRKGKPRPRPAPGAALALAKREQVAIVPSQGKRITFDD